MQIYGELRRRIIAAQPADRQAHLAACLDKLMADVQRNLEPKNRDKFTQVRGLVVWCLLLMTARTPQHVRVLISEGGGCLVVASPAGGP